MKKLYSELVGLPVFDDYSPAPLALVRDILLDHETGNVLAFMVKDRRMIVPLDVERISRTGLFIKDKDHIVEVSDVLRVAKAVPRKKSLVGMRVITQRTKISLGRVVDYEMETRDMSLSAIHTAKTFFLFRLQERIIPRSAIIKIAKDAVIVKDPRVPVLQKEEKLATPSSAFAS